ncbi:MAG: response regulator [Cyclobacteriaceae bacterium]
MVNIVLVDDDKVSNFVTAKLIQKCVKESHCIFKFSSATEALENLYEINPNFIFVDLIMPQMTGWDFLDQLNHETLKSEIYILSGSMDQDDIDKAKNSRHVKKFLPKMSLKDNIRGIFQN